jgi:CBS domain-containing protein
MVVGDIMERDLTSLAEDTPLLEAISVMALHKCSGLPVVSASGRVVGFLSEKDILKVLIPGYLGYMDENFSMPDIEKIKGRIERAGSDPASDHMTRSSIVFDEYETVSSALVTLCRKDIKTAPVVREGMLVGIVDREKILKGFVSDSFKEGEALFPPGV